jgi:hypothetical protein
VENPMGAIEAGEQFDFNVVAAHCEICHAHLDAINGFTDAERRDAILKRFIQAHKDHGLFYDVELVEPARFAGFKAQLQSTGRRLT